MTVLDAATQTVLDQREVRSFTDGVYLRWVVEGHVQIRVSWIWSGHNAVVSGVFFDPAPATVLTQRVVSYTYDGLNRLIGAAESPGTSYAYAYDLAGNRTGVWENGVPTQSYSYNAANQVIGWSYDAAGNLLSDGTTTYTWDALNRTLTRAGASYAYNGDGILVAQTIGGVTTRSAQDLALPLPVILSDGTARYVYGHERLFGDAGSARTWYLGDALGSVRATLDDAGSVIAGASYDPWGAPQTPAIAPFGFTGELQDADGSVYLRARWYDSARGAFGSRDPFAGYPEQPYSLHPYQYGYAAPTIWTDPSGLFVDPRLLQEINAWQRFYSKDGWANCANRPDDGTSNNDGVLDLFIEDFICEYGPADRVFGFDAPLTRELSLSRAIGYLRDQFYKSQGAVVKGGPSQMSKLQGLEAKFYDSVFTLQPISLTDFLGGFDSWTVTKDSFLGQSTIRFEIRNTTSLASGTRNPFARAGSPISMEQYVQNPSQYNWNQTDHAVAFLVDGRYSINTVLSEKPSYLRNPNTKTGLGGGNTTQTFIWEEPYDECYKVQQLDPGLPLVLLPSL